MLQVEMFLNIDQGMVALPAGFLGYQTFSSPRGPVASPEEEQTGASLLLYFPQLQTHLRLHDFFMGMFPLLRSLTIG